MAESASTLELQNRRALEAGRFAERQNNQPNDYLRRQMAGVGSSLDGLQRTPVSQPNSAASSPQTTDAQQGLGPIARLQQIQKFRQQTIARSSNASTQAIAKLNAAYARYFSAAQSELIANVLGFEIFVSPWLFLGTYFMRVMAWFFPIKVKGITVIPPYTLSGGGIGFVIAHTGAVLLILAVLVVVLLLVTFIVWFFTADPITKAQFFLDLLGTSFGSVLNLFGETAATPAPVNAVP